MWAVTRVTRVGGCVRSGSGRTLKKEARDEKNDHLLFGCADGRCWSGVGADQNHHDDDVEIERRSDNDRQ
jgi:hypothetical protein